MKILITGGTVFVSRYAAEHFIKKGHEVYVVNRGTKTQPDGARLIKSDRHRLGDKLKDKRFDLVIDTAYTEADAEDLVNALGEFDDYIFISSSAVYPETLPQPFKEDMPLGENKHWGDYGTNKIAAENFIRGHIPQAYILRPPYLYGQMNNLYREAFVFERAEKALPFYLPDGKLPLQFFDAEDLCGFIEILLEKRPERRIFNVGNPEAVAAEEWVKLCYAAVGKTPEIRYVSEKDGHRPQDYFCFRTYEYALDVSEQAKLMPRTKPLARGLAEAYERYKKNDYPRVKKNYSEYIENNIEKGE